MIRERRKNSLVFARIFCAELHYIIEAGISNGLDLAGAR
jgi:hypothetical protein